MQLFTAFLQCPLCAKPCARYFNCLWKYWNIAVIPVVQKRLCKLPKVTESICRKVGIQLQVSLLLTPSHNKYSLWTPVFSTIKIIQEALKTRTSAETLHRAALWCCGGQRSHFYCAQATCEERHQHGGQAPEPREHFREQGWTVLNGALLWTALPEETEAGRSVSSLPVTQQIVQIHVQECGEAI